MDRFTLAIVGGVVALVAAGLLVAAVFRDRAPAADLSTPSGVVLAYALAEQRGDAAAAWRLLAPAAQARGDRDRFLALAGHATGDADYLSTDNQQIDADGASVVLVRTSPASGGIFSTSYSVRTTVRLTREADGWRISVPPDDYLLVNPPVRP